MRKSLTSLRQAASQRPAPSPHSKGSFHSSSPGSPQVGLGAPSRSEEEGFEQESTNPLFDLQRAAEPSSSSMSDQLQRAADPSTSSLDSELRRAASPSMNSSRSPKPFTVANPLDAELRRAASPSVNGPGSPRPSKTFNSLEAELRRAASPSGNSSRSPKPSRVVKSSLGANPTLSREMAANSRNVPAFVPAGAIMLSKHSTALSSAFSDDPAMSKLGVSDKEAGSKRGLMSSPSSIVLVPARFIKEKTWGTPRRRLCTSICLIAFLIIFIYLAVRLADALKLLNSAPAIAQLKVSNFCNSQLSITVSGSVLNPSAAATTILAMKSELWYQDPKNGSQLVAYINTPNIYVGAGNVPVGISLTAELPLKQGVWIRRLLQNYVNGSELNLIAKIPLSASFGPDVFIFPITFSTALEFKFTIPSLNANTTSNSTMLKNSTELDDDPETIQEIELLRPNDQGNYIVPRLGLALWSKKAAARSMFEITIPPLHFDLYLGGSPALAGKTSFIHYGKNATKDVAAADEGLIRLTGALGTPNIAGVHYGLTQFMNEGPLDVKLVARGPNFTHPEIPPYRTPQNGACHLQSLLDGLTIQQTLDLSTLFAPPAVTPGVVTRSPTPAPVKEPYFDLNSVEILSINSAATIGNRLALDLAGMNQLYGLKGVVPSVQLFLQTDGAVAGTKVDLLYVDLPSSFSFYPNASLVTNLILNLKMQSATQLIRVVDQFIGNNKDFNIYIQTSSDGSIASKLLSAASFKLSTADLLGSGDSGDSRRRLDEYAAQAEREQEHRDLADSVFANKSLAVKVTSNFKLFLINITAGGFDTSFFGGTRIVWQPFTYRLRASNGRGGWIPALNSVNSILSLDVRGYDTNTRNGIANLALGMSDQDNGNFLRALVNNITSFQQLHLHGQIKYGTGPLVGDDFYFERTPDVVNDTRAGEASVSFFELYHVELESLVENEFQTNVFFGLNLGDVNVDVSLPAVAVAISRCTEPYFITVSLDDWNFKTGDRSTAAPLKLKLEDGTKVISAVTTYLEGTPQRICIAGHPDLSTNFLSFFIGALALDLTLPGRDKKATPVANEADLLDLAITSVQREACVAVQLTLTNSNDTSNTSLSLGWGAVSMVWDVTHLNAPSQVLRINVDEGWYGTINQYRKDKFYAPATIKPVSVNVCILADVARPLVTAQDATRGALQNFIDGVARDYTVRGTLNQRYPPNNGIVSNITGNFRAPASAFKSFTTIGGSTQVGDTDPTSWGKLVELKLAAFDGNRFATVITFETGSIGFNLTLPKVQARIGKLTTPGNLGSEISLFEIGAFVPPFGYRKNFPLPADLNISLIAQDWGDTLQLIDDLLTGVADVVVGSSTDTQATLLSKVIPTLTFSLSKKDVVAPPTPGPDRLDVDIRASSSQTSASVLADFKILEAWQFRFIWGTIDCKLFDGFSNEIGRIYVPGAVLQAVNSGAVGVNVTLYGQATAFATRLFNATANNRIGFQGTIGNSIFTSSFKIPPSIVNSIALGKEDNGDAASSSLKLLDASLLGANSVGSSGTLPCLIESLCEYETIQDDSNGPFQGVTAGVTIQFDLPNLGRIKWKISLLSDVSIALVANGFDLGRAILRPISVQSKQNLFSPIVSVIPNNARLPELRSTIASVLDGYDTVFTVGGAFDGNYLSQILKAIEQDIPILDVPEPDPNAPALLGALKLRIFSSIRTRVELDAITNITWNGGDLVISLGSLAANVFYGHTKTCGPGGNKFCLNGINVASGGTLAPLILTPQAAPREVTVRAALFHSGGILSPSQQAADRMVSNVIWGVVTPVEARATITPPVGNRYGSNVAFTLTTYVTLPPRDAASGFIDSIGINYIGTALSLLKLDLVVKIVEVLKNTMSFPLLLSYMQYEIKLVDTDGVDAGGCGLLADGLKTTVNPCTISAGLLCYDPWNVPTSIAPLIRSGDPNNLRPGTSILKNNQKFLLPGQTGSAELLLDVTIETAARLLDEKTKDILCGGISNGMIVAGLVANPNCNDAGRTEADLRCTYPLRILFDLENYPLSAGDTCGVRMDVPNYLGFTFYSAGLFQFDTLFSGVKLNPGNTPVRMLDGSKDNPVFTRSTNTLIQITDSFQISVDVRIAGNGCWSEGEAFALNFLANIPPNAASPPVLRNCGNDGCGYATRGFGGAYASLVIAFQGCNSIAWISNGDTGTPHKVSQSCAGEPIDNGNWGTLTITYNAHDKRATAAYAQSGFRTRSFDFDLDLEAQLGGSQVAYLSVTANKGKDTLLTGSCAIVEYKNIVHRGLRTDGRKTTREGNMPLVRAGEIGFVRFRARDENGRRRGRGGNLWTVIIEDTITNTVANHNLLLAPRIVSRGDGTYDLRYQIYARGRFRVKVACIVGSAPDICSNPGQFVTLTDGLFVRG